MQNQDAYNNFSKKMLIILKKKPSISNSLHLNVHLIERCTDKVLFDLEILKFNLISSTKEHVGASIIRKLKAESQCMKNRITFVPSDERHSERNEI